MFGRGECENVAVGPRGASRIGGGRVKIHVFFEGVRGGTAFQVHVVEERAPDSRMLITFRDYLREHRTRLAGTKRSRTSLPKNTSDGDAYAKAKTSYVWEVVRRAESQRELLIQVHK